MLERNLGARRYAFWKATAALRGFFSGSSQSRPIPWYSSALVGLVPSALASRSRAAMPGARLVLGDARGWHRLDRGHHLREGGGRRLLDDLGGRDEFYNTN